MEKGISKGLGVSRKAATRDTDGGGLGLKLQRIESFPYGVMMHHHRPFSSSKGPGADGPTCNSRANEVARSTTTRDIYDVAGAASGGAVVRTLQPFDISTTPAAASSHTAFKSPAAGMAASLGFPFTLAQWKELERQAMIYKYMMASVPVPPDLLIPIARNLSDPAASHSPLGRGSSIFNLRYTNGSDPEPGRCRRTDGKKWRCSRDVAPNQKYCERHMHRGRPRSRKPVELKSRLQHALPTATAPPNPCLSDPTLNDSASPSPYLKSNIQQCHQTPAFLDKSNRKASPFEPIISASSYKEPRSMDWMMKEETVPVATSDQEWQHLLQTKIGLTTESSFCSANDSVFHQQYKEGPPNLNDYGDLGVGEDKQQNDECALFLNPDALSSGKPLPETPRGFIDAWSNAVTEDPSTTTVNEASASSKMKRSLSNLTLSMALAGGNLIDEEMSQIQMGLGNSDSDRSNGGGGGDRPQLSSWPSPVSWLPSTPGGPLAEVLRPSTVSVGGAASSSPSPHAGHGDSGSPPATTVSSPSGVLQKTLASLSDSSGSSSPTLATSTAKPEFAFPWLNHSKLASSF